MKKIISILCLILVIVCMGVFTGCGDNNNDNDQTNNQEENHSSNQSTGHIHSFGAWIIATEAKCTENGLLYHVCADCGYSERETIFAPGHKGTWNIRKEATCIESGERTIDCQTCLKTIIESIEAKGHSFSDWAVTKESSCGCGQKVRTCEICELTEKIVIEPDLTKQHEFDANNICIVCNEHKGTEGLIFEIKSDYAMVTGYNGTENDVYIPSTYAGAIVKEIAAGAFLGKPIKTIIIPDSVTNIGRVAFKNCSGLTSVTIGNSMTSISEFAFENCNSLTSVYYTGDIAGWCGILFDGRGYANPMGYASNLYIENKIVIDLVIPNSVTSIGFDTFINCIGLTSVTIPDSVTSIGGNAFYGCSGLTSVTIGSSVTSIGNTAFQYCYKLVEVHNKSSLNITAGRYDYGYVGYYAKEIYTEPYVSKLSTTDDGYILYTDGAEISLIGYTGNETDLTLPSNITNINQYAFFYCSGLTSIIIPESVTSIGEYAFYDCNKLVEIYNKSSLNIIAGSYNYGNVGYYAKEIYTESYVSKLSMTNDGYILYTDGDEISLIGYTGNETDLTLPSNITNINQYAFYFCSGLTSVTIGNFVTSIGEYAFAYCSGLTSIIIPDSMTSIDKGAFIYCSGLTSVTFENSSGWYVSNSSATIGTQITLTNASQNVTYLSSTYGYYYWKCK